MFFPSKLLKKKICENFLFFHILIRFAGNLNFQPKQLSIQLSKFDIIKNVNGEAKNFSYQQVFEDKHMEKTPVRIQRNKERANISGQ